MPSIDDKFNNILILLHLNLCAAMWGAGLSFHRCHAEINVPVDPYLDNVFDGEEGSRGIRFFTHGYDVYSPHRVLVTHDYVSRNSSTEFDLFVFCRFVVDNLLRHLEVFNASK